MASRRVTVSVEGLERLRAKLSEVPPHIRDGAGKAVEDGAEAVRDQVRATVGVHSGRLKRTVKVREIGTAGLSSDVGWFGREEYYAKFVEFGTSSIRANPVLTTAAEEERTRFDRRVRDEVQEELDNL